MEAENVPVEQTSEGRWLVGDAPAKGEVDHRLVVTAQGVYPLPKDGVAGAKLGNGDVTYAQRLYSQGKS